MTYSGTPESERFAADVKSAWAEVFPKSRLSVGAFTFGGIGVTGYLAASREEVANGIWQNDPLMYGGFLYQRRQLS